MSNSDKSLHSAAIHWRDGHPVSDLFDDMYFNLNDGLRETEHVFLRGNQLHERFERLTSGTFTIAETGFGTGLNFLAACGLWLRHTPQHVHLHYVSVEKFPLSHADLTTALSQWPELEASSAQLLDAYPENVPGYHRISFYGGRIELTMILSDAINAYRSLNAKVDAWFLDGFAPSKNPEMWNEDLFAEMARLSHAGTTLATFTAAGFVRRGLAEQGFKVSKVPGFGRKREMVIAQFDADHNARQATKPWQNWPSAISDGKECIVIGAGIAGCSTARALAVRGFKVTLIDKGNRIANAGSGNHQGALYAKLPVDHNAHGQLHLSGLEFTRRILRQLDPEETFWGDCGLLQLAMSDKEIRRQATTLERTQFSSSVLKAVSAEEASDIAGTDIAHPAIFMEHGGWAAPDKLCEKLIQHPNIHLLTNTEVSSLHRNVHSERWELQLHDDTSLSSKLVLICTASDAKRFEQLAQLPIKPIRGQTSVAPVSETKLKTVVCGDGYISPGWQNQYCFGATFDLNNLSTDVRQEDHHANLCKLRKVLPEVGNELADMPLTGHAAYRCSTADYIPICGPAPDYEAFVEDFGKLRTDKNWDFGNAQPRFHDGLFVNVGHGSKGLITGLICSEMVASGICGEPMPVEQAILDAVNPARFIIRNLIRKAI